MSPRTAARDPKGTKILHVEDNPENRLLVRTVLEADGYVVVEAEDGLAGIEAALREQPALILLDINLPGVDGYAVAAILKSFPALVTTPVIAITAYGMEGDRQRTLVAGCDGYLNKPIDVDGFPQQVADFLRGKRERVEEAEQSPYLRELNQRLVYRLVNQVEELKRLNDHFVRRANQLEQFHAAVQDITSELGVQALLERFLPVLAQALGAKSLAVDLTDPTGVRVVAEGDPSEWPRGVLEGAGADGERTAQWEEIELTLPLSVRGRALGALTARLVLPPGAKSDEEQLLKIVANQVAIAVENARLYQAMVRKAAYEETLVEAGRLLASTLQVAEVLQRLAELVKSRLAIDVVRIWLKDPATGDAVLRTETGDLRRPGAQEGRHPWGEGLIGWVATHGAPLLIADLGADARLLRKEWIQLEGFVSAIALPLVLDGATVGVLVGMSRSPRAFLAEEVALAEALANSAAVAIRNAGLFEDAQQRLRQTETLLEVSRAIGSTLELSEVARRTTREIVRLLGADIGAAWLVVESSDRLVPLAGYHVPKEILDSVVPPISGDRLVQEVIRLRGPLYASDSANDPRFSHPFLARLRHRSVLILPMYVKDEAIGGFSIVWTRAPHALTPDELRLVEGIARQAAVAIENSRLYEDLKRQMEELRRTQGQLIQSAKLAAIGELTANVAHEINNPLTSVLGFASYLTEQLEPGQPMWEELDLIRAEAQRARDIVRDLLDFSRPRDFMPEPADLNLVVQQTLRMVQRQGVLDSIELREEYAEGLPTIDVDVPRMKQVFLNILNNALHAMSEGGVLTVRTARLGGGVRVDFTDTGSGIAPGHLGRIFDPFFTTKPEVTGTGLGLSVSLGLVRRHGGTIEVESELGKGSTFTIKLPRRPGAGAAAEPF